MCPSRVPGASGQGVQTLVAIGWCALGRLFFSVIACGALKCKRSRDSFSVSAGSAHLVPLKGGIEQRFASVLITIERSSVRVSQCRKHILVHTSVVYVGPSPAA